MIASIGEGTRTCAFFYKDRDIGAGQEGAGEVAVAKRNDRNERRWHSTTTKEEEGQLSDVTWPPMTYNEARC